MPYLTGPSPHISDLVKPTNRNSPMALGILLTWFLLCGGPLWSQDPLPKAEDLFAKALEASGEANAVAKLQGIRLEGTMTVVGQPTIEVEEIHWKGQRGRTTINLSGTIFVLRIHPDGIWLETSGKKTIVPDQDGMASRIACVPILAVEYPSLFDSVTTTEATVFEGEACHEVECMKAGNLIVTVYFSKKSNLIFGYDFNVKPTSDGVPKVLSLVFEDFRLVDGIQVAHRITYQESHGDQVLTVKKATLNPDFDPRELELPPELKTTSK